METMTRDRETDKAPKSAGRARPVVGMILGLALGALSGVLAGLAVGVGISLILGIL